MSDEELARAIDSPLVCDYINQCTEGTCFECKKSWLSDRHETTHIIGR